MEQKKVVVFNGDDASPEVMIPTVEILEIMANGDCKLKDIHTLEFYDLHDLVRYGKGEDFEVIEI